MTRRKQNVPTVPTWPWYLHQEFEQLATYNAERHRGIVHTEEYDTRMTCVQKKFDVWAARAHGII